MSPEISPEKLAILERFSDSDVQNLCAEVRRLRQFIEHIADLPIADGPHVAALCGCPVHQAERFADWRTG